MRDLKDKVALVTGCSSGIGKATAVAFARKMTKVAVCDIRQKEGEELVEEIKKAGGEAVFIKTDVSKLDDVESAVNKTVKTFGKLDFGINNAGIGCENAFIDRTSKENWDNVININLTGVWICMKYEIAQMLKTGGGVIVNVASVAGLVASGFGYASYYASKHGVIGLTKAAALEYAQKGIRVNTVCPGFINTAMFASFSQEIKEGAVAGTPIGRLGEPEEVADSILWLCSGKSSLVTGHTLVIDGGYVAQ